MYIYRCVYVILVQYIHCMHAIFKHTVTSCWLYMYYHINVVHIPHFQSKNSQYTCIITIKAPLGDVNKLSKKM